MSKRRADKQLTHDNWDQSDDEAEAAGRFQTADQATLRGRVIKKARRRVDRSAQQGAAPSPFAAFSGFGVKSTPSTNTNNLFSFLSNTPTTSALKPTSTDPPPLAPSPAPAVSKSPALPRPEEEKENMSGSPVLPRPPIHRSSPSTGGAGSSGGGTATAAADSEYHRQLMALNRCLLSWVQRHVQASPLCILSPVFKDYEAHLSRIRSKYGDGATDAPAEGTTSPTARSGLGLGATSPSSAPAGGLNFGTTATSPVTEKASAGAGFSFGAGSTSAKSDGQKAAPATGFSFGLSAAAAPAGGTTSGLSTGSKPTAGGGFSFGSDSANAGKEAPSTGGGSFSFGTQSAGAGKEAPSVGGGGFSFGTKSADAGKEASSAGGFSFGASASSTGATSTASTGGFSFGFSNAAKPNKAPVAETTAAEEEESDEPPKVEVKTVQEEDAVYSKRCKLFYKKDGSFVEKGVGMLHLKPCKDDKFQCLIRADTNLGNILLNIKLNKSIPTQRMGKNNVMLACVPNPPLDAKQEATAEQQPVPLLIRVKTADDADQLLQQLDEHKR